MDMERMWGTFIEEMQEKLAEIESGLLVLESAPDDMDLINTIFRAVHTVKGSSGAMGQTDISGFAHSVEEVLDALRNGAFRADHSVVDLLLKGADTLREMMCAIAAREAPDMVRANEVKQLIKTALEAKAGQTTPGSVEAAAESAIPSECDCGDIQNQYLIRFMPDMDMFRRGLNPVRIFDDLRDLGTVVSIRAVTDRVPGIFEIDPETAYMGWEIVINTCSGREELLAPFEFLSATSDITISQIKSDDVNSLGIMLIREGIVSEQDVRESLNDQKRLGEILVEKGKASQECIDRVLDKQRTAKADTFSGNVASSIRVDIKKLDHLINLVGEMVIIHSIFFQLLSKNGGAHNDASNGGEISDTVNTEQVSAILSQLQRIGKDIQESTMSLRMLPVGEVFHRFHRLVRELAATRSMEIDLILSGEETEMDKSVLEKISDPMVHLVRNAIDHGLESVEERLACGKPARGSVHLNAYQAGDAVYIEVEDDGRGLNRERIMSKAIEKGIVPEGEPLTDEQVWQLIFMPGFSTAKNVSDVSGRGVGMDVVKRNIEALNGRVAVQTSPGRGSIISLRIPLTLAIIDGLIVSVGEERYIIPITAVEESFRPRPTDVKTVSGRGELVDIRGQYLRLIRLHEHFRIDNPRLNPWEAIVVVVHYEGKKCCLLADELLGQQQVVIKNLGKALPKVADIAGGTILGDGRVALVLDVGGIVSIADLEDAYARA